jgi:hypothetical protein
MCYTGIGGEIMDAKSAIKKIAKQDNVSEEEVRREIQNAIDQAWETKTVLQAVLFPDGKPDPETFLERLAQIAKK